MTAHISDLVQALQYGILLSNAILDLWCFLASHVFLPFEEVGRMYGIFMCYTCYTHLVCWLISYIFYNHRGYMESVWGMETEQYIKISPCESLLNLFVGPYIFVIIQPWYNTVFECKCTCMIIASYIPEIDSWSWSPKGLHQGK
jgi:hypothetical protein